MTSFFGHVSRLGKWIELTFGENQLISDNIRMYLYCTYNFFE